jgi:hemolysin III
MRDFTVTQMRDPESYSHHQRPSFRGHIHRHAATAAVPLFAWLIIVTDTWTQRLAVIVYAIGVTTMFAVSAVYHSGSLSPRAEAIAKRIDHSTILLAIASSYTAITTLALSGTAEMFLLIYIWLATAVGVGVRLLWLESPYFVNALIYLAAGWSALLVVPAFVSSLGAADLVLIFVGGGIYTIGAIVYALHKPNPWPNHFGYHEIFHVLVTMGAAVHFILVARLVLNTL